MAIGAGLLSVLFCALGIVALRADFFGLPLATVGLAPTLADTRLVLAMLGFGFAGLFAVLGAISWYLKAIY